jgi:O-antigen/teichoic acid export membrane protein
VTNTARPSALKNWTYLLASDVTQQVISFLVLIVLARKLAPEGYGQFAVILSLVGIVSVFANFGMNLVLTREITLDPGHTKKYVSLIAPIRLASFLIAVGVFVMYYCLYHDGDRATLVFVTILVLSAVLWDICESIAFGHFITKYSSYLNITFAVLWLLSIAILPNTYFSIRSILVIYSSILSVKAIGYIILIKKYFIRTNNNEADTNLVDHKKMIFMSLPYLWGRGLGVLTDQVPILILNAVSGAMEVGFFSVGSKLILPISIALSTALRAMFPFMTKLYNEDKEVFSRRIKDGITVIVCFGTIIALAASISSKYWIPLLFGNAYIQSVASFNFLVWFGVILTVDLLLSAALSSSYKQNALAILTTIDVVIAMPIYYLGALQGSWGLSFAKFMLGLITLTYHWIVFAKLLKVTMRLRDGDTCSPAVPCHGHLFC